MHKHEVISTLAEQLVCTHTLTTSWQSQLPADDFCIPEVPQVITHCAPGVIEAHFHTSLQLCVTSYQPHISIVAD